MVRPAFTLIELLIVIALFGIIAGFGWPSLAGWNCKQELRNEFEALNSVFENARVEAVNRNRSILIEPNNRLPSVGATYSVFLLSENICSATQARQSLSLVIPNLTISNNYTLRGAAFQCFHADGSATASQANQVHRIERTCSGEAHSYQTVVFGATGLFEKRVFFAGTAGFLDL
tara:strand:- start:1247 stop:1771 length:525 start_codon:yes stop_codon:yes gene_type:complete